MKSLIAALSVALPILLATALDPLMEPLPAEPRVWSDEELERSPPEHESDYLEVLELVDLHRAYLVELSR